MGPIPIFISYHIWLVVSTPLKNMRVSWDHEIPNIWKKTSHVPNHQPDKNPIIPFQNPKQTFAKTSQQDMEPRCHSAFPLLESELLELQEDEESTDILPSDVADFFWGVQSSRTGRFNHQKIYGFIVLGSYGAIMIYHDLT